MRHFDRLEGIDENTYCWGCEKPHPEKLYKYHPEPLLEKDYYPLYICDECMEFLSEHPQIKSFRRGDIKRLEEFMPDESEETEN